MISREEVAKKLREAGKELDNTFDKSDDGNEFLAAFIAIDLAIGQPKRSPFEFSPFFNRLADLIDPEERTCHVSEEHIDHEPTLDSLGIVWFACDKCGWGWYEGDTCYYPSKPHYCPHCGARVVRDEA